MILAIALTQGPPAEPPAPTPIERLWAWVRMNVYEPLSAPWYGSIHKTAAFLGGRKQLAQEDASGDPREAPAMPVEKPQLEQRRDNIELIRKRRQ